MGKSHSKYNNNDNSCSDEEEPGSITQVLSTKKLQAFRIESVSGTYRAIPSNLQMGFMIFIKLQNCDQEKYLAIERKILHVYPDLIINRKDYHNMIYQVVNKEIMIEIIEAILYYLNMPNILNCYGCKKKFLWLRNCIKHKKNCNKLRDLTQQEKILIYFIKYINFKDYYLMDKKKEIIYEFSLWDYTIKPIEYVYWDDVIPEINMPIIFESDRYILFGEKLDDLSITSIHQLVDNIL